MDIPDRMPLQPLDRFRVIYRELITHDRWFDPGAMRFAASAAVLMPGEPQAIAARIRVIADGMKARSHWWEMMHSQLRYVIASMEALTGDDPMAFDRERHRLSDIFRRRHIPHGHIYEIMAIVLLRLSFHGQPRVRGTHLSLP